MTAVAYVLAGVTLAVIFRHHLRADFIPLDHSNVAPNILATIVQIIVASPVAVLLWPPTRRRLERAMHRFADRKLAAVHDGIGRLIGHHEKHHDDLSGLRAELAEHREHERALHAEHADKLDRILEAQDGKTRND